MVLRLDEGSTSRRNSTKGRPAGNNSTVNNKVNTHQMSLSLQYHPLKRSQKMYLL